MGKPVNVIKCGTCKFLTLTRHELDTHYHETGHRDGWLLRLIQYLDKDRQKRPPSLRNRFLLGLAGSDFDFDRDDD